MLGFIIGIIAGAIQYWILVKFTKAVAGGILGLKTVCFAIAQFFLPAIILSGCAFLLRESLLFAGIGMAASLTILAISLFARSTKSGAPGTRKQRPGTGD